MTRTLPESGIPHVLKSVVDELLSYKIKPRHVQRKLKEAEYESNVVDEITITQINNRSANLKKQVKWHISNNAQWNDFIRCKLITNMDNIILDSYPMNEPLVMSSFKIRMN